ncbi:uncharacterized protein LOC132935209 isoform X1 [Metopolophium dirhodum]|uniref:uncharacterized protein LOC132935209 isoform X1 n=1 Tax=Metopolophium dirhodum TaxID=44670 RepID=UPI00298F6193|nr:uncharacterized protein LOC132935209 isoform X1 [Metopolophium dirhodum]
MEKCINRSTKKQNIVCEDDPVHNLETIEKSKCYIFNGKFFKIINEEDNEKNKISAQCQNCPKIVHGHKGSTGNFLSHIKFKHLHLMEKVKAAKTVKKNVQSIKKQETLPLSHTNKISKQKITDLTFAYIVEEMRPLVTCEKPAFKRLIKGLCGLGDTTSLPDRRVMSNELNNKYTSYITMLTDLIAKQNFICTTADIWSCNNKSYLGMTGHFIDEHTYIRHSYILGCRRIKGSHTFLNITEIMNEITHTYNIQNSKISHTVTDNASNFGKAFRTYSLKSIGVEFSNIGNDNWFADESICDDPNTGVEIDNSSTDFDTVDFSTLFLNSEDMESDEICLPDHITCSAHTLSLIATVDVDKISDQSYKLTSKNAFNKLCSFWNLLSRSTVASDKVYDICDCKFPIPIVTRWNSSFDAVKKIIAHKETVKSLFTELKLEQLTKKNWVFLEEYCAVMEPLAIALDKLQAEKSCFLGYVAPTIISLRLLLIQQTNLIYCRHLALSIIKSLEKRFYFIFDLENIKGKPYIIASISHPRFKLSWIPGRYLTFCKNLFLSECNFINSLTNSDSNSVENDSAGSDEEFYGILTQSKYSLDRSASDNVHCVELNLNSTNEVTVQALSYLDSKNKDLDMLNTFPVVKKVFFKYNTTLPSSAPVERLFSSGSQILTPRRNRLQDKTFEMLLCCRCLMLNERI